MGDGARLVDRRRVWPLVTYSMFAVFDPRHPGVPGGDDVPALEELLRASGGGVLFRSAGNDFYPAVDVEVWSAEPPRDAGDWDEVDEAGFEAPSGMLWVENVADDGGDPDISVGFRGPVRVRAYARGRGEVMEKYDLQESFFRGVEQWLIQVWPAQSGV